MLDLAVTADLGQMNLSVVQLFKDDPKSQAVVAPTNLLRPAAVCR